MSMRRWAVAVVLRWLRGGTWHDGGGGAQAGQQLRVGGPRARRTRHAQEPHLRQTGSGHGAMERNEVSDGQAGVLVERPTVRRSRVRLRRMGWVCDLSVRLHSKS